MLGLVDLAIAQHGLQDEPLRIQHLEIEVDAEGIAAELLGKGLHLHATQSAHRQCPHPANDEVGDVVVEIAHRLGDEIPALQDADLVGDVRSLPLEAPADDAFHHLAGLVVLVLLFQQDLSAGAVVVHLLVRQHAGIPIRDGRQEQQEQPILGRHLQRQPQLFQAIV